MEQNDFTTKDVVVNYLVSQKSKLPASFQKLSQKRLEFLIKISEPTFENLPENTKICAVYETGQSAGFFLAEDGKYYNPILLLKSKIIDNLEFSLTVDVPGFSNLSNIKFAMFSLKENKYNYLKDSISIQSFSV